MVTDDERREVTRRLRNAEKHAIPYARISDNPMTAEFIAAAVFYDLPYVRELFSRLADLIEPTCDRDALLALADALEAESLAGWASGPVNVGEYACRIREACGEAVDGC